VTFLFTDIDGSSDLAQRHPDAFPALLDRHNALLRQAVEAHDGFVFQIVGDAFCVAFHTAGDAVGAALEAQRRLHEEPWAPATIRVRMGLNTGTARAETEGDRAGGYTGYSTLARVQRVMSAGHGGQIVLSDSTAVQARGDLPDGVTLRDLGRHQLKGLLEPEHLWQLLARGLPESFPPLMTLSSVPSNLPAALNRFVGRSRELQQVEDLLGEARLVTLVGPGGTGKTRLAVEVASRLRDGYEDRVYLIDLSESRDVESVLSLTAQAVGLREERPDRTLLDDLKGQIGDQRTLLVLDNFEQVLEAAPVVTALLQDCARLTLLVTTREALRVSGEQIFPVPPLALPQTDENEISLERIAGTDAVQLFVERARAVQPDFRLTEANARAVAELCLGLDGLPLAIELATARLGLLSPEALVKRLGSRLELLKGGPRDAPARQRTLRDTIGWSYSMLDHGEQWLFRVFSVFSGASLEAVEEVAGRIDGGPEVEVLEAVGSLVDKSLIRRAEGGTDPPRLRMLETIREYATARLEEDAALAKAARCAHASWFAEWTGARWAELTGAGREDAADRMVTDIDNVRTAWRHWVEEKDVEQLGRLTDSLWLLYDQKGWYHATVSLTTDLLDVLGSTPSTPDRVVEEITLQTSLARVLMVVRGVSQEVEDAFTRALELCEGRGEVPELLPVLRGLSSFYVYRSEFGKAAEMAERILGLAERHDDAGARVEGHLVLGVSLAFLGRLRSGMENLEKGIAAFDREQHASRPFQLGNNSGVVCFTTSAMVLWMLGYPDRARERGHEAIALAEELGHPSSVAYAYFHTGLVHLWRREPDEVEACTRAVIDIADEHDFPLWRAVSSCLRGAALVENGSEEEGLALVEAAVSTYQRLQTPPVFWPLLLHIHAGACGAAGRGADGLALEDEAIEIASASEGQTLASEFLHRRGELLLAVAPDLEAEVEVWLQRAVDEAAAVEAPMLQLRAALRLGELWRSQGRTEDARELVGEAYERFSEGFATADLREARSLLDALARQSSGSSPGLP
jgi:predicted ATPase/class 3 adenylate cyclase